jgi:hypothetical protein
MDRTFLVKGHATIEVSSRTKEVHPSLAVIAFVRVVHFGLSKKQDLCTEGVPFDLCAISFVEGLLARGNTIQ